MTGSPFPFDSMAVPTRSGRRGRGGFPAPWALGMRWLVRMLLLGYLLTSRALALDPQKALTQYQRRVWQSEQGLPQNTVLAICQTRDGYLWLGTQEGLARFDGVRFTVFDKRTTPELNQNWITSLCEDREGDLWIGLRGGGVRRYRQGRFETFTKRDGLPDDRVRVLYADRQGNLWIGTAGGGLCRYREGRFTSYSTKDGLSNDQVVALLEDHAGTLWIGTFGGGLNRFAGGRFTAFTTKEGLSHDQVSSLCEDQAGDLWIGTFGGGLNRLRAGRLSHLGSRQGLSHDEVWSICEDRQHNLWIATGGGGLNRLSQGRATALTKAQGLSNDVVLSLLEDREGSLWVGTAGGGLNQLRDGKFTPFGKAEGLAGEVVMSVFEDRQGAVWMGTDGAGLYRYAEGRFTAFGRAQGLSNEHVTSICEDRDGGLWVGTLGGGVNHYAGGRFSSFTTRQGLSSDDILALLPDPDGGLWIGTDGGGLNRLRNGRITVQTNAAWLGNSRVVALLRDREGALWVGTSGSGLGRLREGQRSLWTQQQGLSENRVLALHEDPEGNLWIGTSGGGLNLLRGGKITAITARDGLHDDKVFRILEDARGILWMTSNRGIFRASRSDLLAFAAGRRARVECVAYGTDDGMTSVECSGENQPAGWKSRDGKLWFPTLKGVVMADPARMPFNDAPPPLAIEGMDVDGRRLALTGGAESPIQLPAGSRKFDLHFTALSLAAPQKVRLKYWLEGFDADWVEARADRTAHFTNLRPGAYRLRVKACNNDGVWNETGTTLHLRLLPFFYQTRTFQVLCGLGLVLSGFGAQRLRIRTLKLRAKELERTVEARTADLRIANEELREAQEQLARLAEARPEKLENVSMWGATMAEQVGRAIHARRIHVWRVDGESFQPISPWVAVPPSWELLERARHASFAPTEEGTVVRVEGMTGELRGVLVVEGSVQWGDTERHLVMGLAQHLGTSLDLQRLREQLTSTEAKQVEVRQRMQERGIHTLLLCPRCGRCYDETATRCEIDGSALDATRLLPFRVQDRYRLDTFLGEGGMGSVFEALDEKLGRHVALKVIRAEALKDAEARFRMEREAHTLALIHHPSVIDLFDSGELEDGSAFLVMELLSGRDLANILQDHGAGSPAQVGALLRHVAAGLGATHRAGIIHRDIKPANIYLVAARGGFQAKVLDFGLAKSSQTEERLTQTGIVMGTVAYMSPEQVQGLPVDEGTDLYSLAVVAFEALTGFRVVPGKDMARMMMDVLCAVPPKISDLLPGLPPAVDAAFEAAMAKKASDRPRPIEAWAEALAAQLEALPRKRAQGWPSTAFQSADQTQTGRALAGGRSADLQTGDPGSTSREAWM